MKATFASVSTLLLIGLSGSFAQAQFVYPHTPAPTPTVRYYPPAPDMCGPGFYALNCCGCPYGPIYCVRPPWEPFNGLRPNLQGPSAAGPGLGPQARGVAPPLAGLPPLASLPQQPRYAPQPPVSFPTHPFARSPRDFFMYTEVTEDEAWRQRLPVMAP
jgi:hypothetical protein